MRKVGFGIIGCGVISTAYLKAAQRFANLELRAVADSHGWSLEGITVFEMKLAEETKVSDEYTLFHPAEVELSADRPFAVFADGDFVTDLPARLRVLPRALRVIAPPGDGR